MKTYYVRSDNTEFMPVRAKSRIHACNRWILEHADVDDVNGNSTLFVERNGTAVPHVFQDGFGWIDKRTTINASVQQEA